MLLSVSGFESGKTVQVRIYNVTTATEVVAWIPTGVVERADGEGYSTYRYIYATVSGDEYIVDWKDNSTPIVTASEGISSAQTRVAALAGDIPTAIQNADALLNRDMSAVSDTNARSPLNAFRFIRNKWAVAAGILTVRKEDDATSAWTAAVSTDAAADPIIGNDPA